MIIEVLNQKYLCGCNRGITAIEKPKLLINLNMVIEWDFCRFPMKTETSKADPNNPDSEEIKKEVEDRAFLGEEPELKPGNVFLYKGQVIAVDSEDRLVLLVSETGYGALERIYKEDFETEFCLIFNNYKVENVTWNVVEDGVVPDEYDIIHPVPYNLYKIWKERFVAGRGFLEHGLCIETVLDSEDFIFSINILMTDWNVRFKSSQVDEEDTEMMDNMTKELLSWFYENYKRVKSLERKEN